MAITHFTTSWKYELGSELRDLVSGFKGIVEMRREHLNGCLQYLVQAKIKKGAPSGDTAMWIDEVQLEKIGEGLNKKAPIVRTASGGPRSTERRETR